MCNPEPLPHFGCGAVADAVVPSLPPASTRLINVDMPQKSAMSSFSDSDGGALGFDCVHPWLASLHHRQQILHDSNSDHK